MREWKGLRRFYSWGISRNVKKLITRKHRESFIDFERKGSFDKIDWRKISSSSSLEELDTAINKYESPYYLSCYNFLIFIFSCTASSSSKNHRVIFFESNEKCFVM